MRDPIVITGAGLVTCLGLNREAVWARVRRGEHGIGPAPALEQTTEPDKGAGQAPDLPKDFHPELPREVRYLRYAVQQAWHEAGLDQKQHDGA